MLKWIAGSRKLFILSWMKRGLFLSASSTRPSATKIMQREQIVRFRNYLIAEGLVLLADKKSPRFIQDKMNSFLDPAIHFNIDKMKR